MTAQHLRAAALVALRVAVVHGSSRPWPHAWAILTLSEKMAVAADQDLRAAAAHSTCRRYDGRGLRGLGAGGSGAWLGQGRHIGGGARGGWAERGEWLALALHTVSRVLAQMLASCAMRRQRLLCAGQDEHRRGSGRWPRPLSVASSSVQGHGRWPRVCGGHGWGGHQCGRRRHLWAMAVGWVAAVL